jgi:hypothetical protein
MRFLLLFVVLSLFSFSSENDKEKMQWNESRKLTWADFQGRPLGGNDFVASTNSGISFSYSFRIENGELDLNYTIQSNFYPKLSWFKPGNVSDYILEHEQTHFDISELFARKLRKKMMETGFSSNPKKAIDAIYEKNEQERRAFQNRYDSETDHSKIPEAEYRWREYVKKQLELHERWK